MPSRILPITTAGTRPESFPDELFFARNPRIVVIILVGFMILGFGLRVFDLDAESLSEDELNKLETVREYRSNGLSGKNGEHPFLMKGLQTLSVSATQDLNSIAPMQISEETALRFPIALFGTFTALLIFLLISELFGRSIGLVSAIFWTIEPMAIGFDRIAKEDGLVVFFFLLTMYFWVRSQTRAELGDKNWTRYAWAAAVAFAALMASKYYPHLLAVLAGYYIVFQYIPSTNWRMEPARWAKFVALMAIAFLILNPTILLPETWREMLNFSTESRIGHDGYEYLGNLYTNKMTAWFSGVPWTFYYVFLAVKTSLPIFILFIAGITLVFRRSIGDGRFFLYLWAFAWFVPFTFLGGKFTRYFAVAEPLILVVAATAFCFFARLLAERFFSGSRFNEYFQIAALIAVIAFPIMNSINASPHFRLFTNAIGGGAAAAGKYFPHDEFYDAATRAIIARISETAAPKTAVACETPGLFEYYAKKAGREDLRFLSLSDKAQVADLAAGDAVVITEGRRYFSNSAYIAQLRGSAQSPDEIRLGEIVAARIYRLSGPLE